VTAAGGRAQTPPPEVGPDGGSAPFAEVVAQWVEQGAHWIHVVDADAVAGTGNNLGVMAAGEASLQYAGAVADDASLAAALASGVSRVVIEPSDPAWVCRAVAEHGDRVAVALDLRTPHFLARAEQFEQCGCRRFVVSDLAHAEQWRAGDRHLLAELCTHVGVPVMALGSIGHLRDLHELHELVEKGLDGIIIGKGLYDGSFTYAEAAAASADRFDVYYWGPPSA